MIEVRCNGKTYLFDKSSGIIDKLGMMADDVRDDAEDSAPQPPYDGYLPIVNKKLYTHDLAASVCEAFENLLEEKDISIPCADSDEQSDREDAGDSACIYGTEYSRLLDDIENTICGALDACAPGGPADGYVRDEFSGQF